MKTFCIAFIACLFTVTSNANDPTAEQSEIAINQNIELKKLINNMFEEKPALVHEQDQKTKIVIMNSDFRKVRVGEVENIKEIDSQSTLVPVIYRSVFVTKIHNVAYYMLKD